MKIILGIETSCDDTSLAIIQGETGIYTNKPKILSHFQFSQEKILKKWGGVVPEIASRNHLKKLQPLLEESILKANITLKDIDAIAVTTYPGLLGPLLTGLNVAKTISLIEKVPIIPINHLLSHIEAIHLTQNISYPYLGLIVSGGHSLFLLMNSPTNIDILGSTIDDAAGEAFDKGGKLLGLGYPAGKIIDDLAKESSGTNQYSFPIGLKNSSNANLSYSGVKTSLRKMLSDNNESTPIKDETKLKEICFSYQDAIVQALKLKMKYALKESLEKTQKKNIPIVVGGGVAANSHLREILTSSYSDVFFVEPKFCTDNGAMIANYGLRIFQDMIQFPKCLELDAKSSFINKRDFH